VEHRQPVSKYVDGGEPAVFENVSAAHGFQKRQAQQQIDARRQIERVSGEFAGVFERRVGANSLDARRRLRHRQKIGLKIQFKVTVDDVRRDDPVTGFAQYLTMAPRPAAGSHT
jgi:hypothetical protein